MFLLSPEGVTVACNEKDLHVEINRSIYTGFTEPHNLRLKDSSCLPSFSNASINFNIPLGTCGTTVVISSDGVKSFHHNEIITNSTGSTEFNIICSFDLGE